MRNLYLRFFLTFFAAILLVMAGTMLITSWQLNQRRDAEIERQDELAVAARAALDADGRDGLRDWLREQLPKQAQGDQLFIIDDSGADLLRRPVPEYLQARMGRRPFPARQPATRDGRFLTRMVGPEGDSYALSYNAQRRPYGPLGFTETPWIAAAIALLVSAGLSYLLARYLSRPIQVLRNATHTIAAGDLSVQVAGLMRGRRDELGTLAVDFDAMAVRLRALIESHQTLLRDVSHELRSPLARLQIALELARRPNARLGQELDRIEQEAQRLDTLIGEILSLCRLDDPVRQLELEDVHLHELLESLCDGARVEAEPRAVQVQLAVSGDPSVRGDRELLFRAFENVLRNAVRFSPDGGVVSVNLQPAGTGATVTVEDQGPGVPEESLQRIFEPFYRVADARDRDSGGHGIGLAITSRVLRLHNGTVAAANRPGGGLRVTLTLP